MATQPFVGVTLARIIRPWGHRGQVIAEVFTDFPDRLLQLREAWLSDGRTIPRLASIQSCRKHMDRVLFHFAGIDSIDTAERLRGLEVQVPIEQRMLLDPGRYYVTDLIGCAVWQEGAAAPLGRVKEVTDNGAPGSQGTRAWLLSVETETGELLIPLAEEICRRIDINVKRIDVRLPNGLQDLNVPPKS